MTTSGHRRAAGIPGRAEVVGGHGNLPVVRATTEQASGLMYLHGGQVMSWQPAGQDEMLFTSAQARWEPGRAIRGGVPVCFPWFGPHPERADAPAHGTVRTRAWHLEALTEDDRGVTVAMSIESDEDSRRWWQGDFRLVHRVTFGRELTMALEVRNTGRTPMRVEAALHTYYRVGAVETIRLTGLDDVLYRDSADDDREKRQAGDVTIASETDRVYLDTRDAVELVDPSLKRRIRVEPESARTTVVWNPWTAKARALADLGDDEWRQFVCIETCNASPFAIELAPGERHVMGAVVRVESL